MFVHHKELLRPHYAFRSIADIDFERLRADGIKKYLIDLDGTLVPWLTSYVDPRYRAKLEQGFDEGWIEDICVFSNAGIKPLALRVAYCARKINAKWHACYRPGPMKPEREAFYPALGMIDGCEEDTAIIGDQLAKDIAGGHAVGIRTVLVESLNPPIIGRSYLPRNVRQIKELGIEFQRS